MPVGVRVGSVVVGSIDPGRLRAWYERMLVPGEAGAGVTLELDDGTRLIFDQRGDVAGSAQEPGRLLINLYVKDLRAFAERLSGLGVHWVRPVEEFGPGLISTLRDPDGNYVQLVQLANQPPA